MKFVQINCMQVELQNLTLSSENDIVRTICNKDFLYLSAKLLKGFDNMVHWQITILDEN